MPDQIDALLGLVDPNDMGAQQALAHQLRGDSQAGEFYSLSPTLGDYGKTMQKSALSSAKTGGERRNQGLARSRQAEQDKLRLKQQGRTNTMQDTALELEAKRFADELKLNAATAKTKREQELADAEAKRKHELEKARLKAAATVAAAEAKAGVKAETKLQLTPGQVQTGMRTLEKNVKPFEDLFGSFNELTTSLQPYAKGGDKENENIPGIGFFEGSRGLMGDIWRMTGGGQDSQDMFRQLSSVMTTKIRESAGTAQTFSETQNVLKAHGTQDFSTEESALGGYQELMRAIMKDQQRILATTNPQVLEQFSAAYQDGAGNPLLETMPQLDFSNRIDPDADPAGGGGGAVDARIAEIKAQLGEGG